MFEEAFNQGYPQELRHFVRCVREDIEPLVTAADGRPCGDKRAVVGFIIAETGRSWCIRDGT
jgi:hypothetical protein